MKIVLKLGDKLYDSKDFAVGILKQKYHVTVNFVLEVSLRKLPLSCVVFKEI